MFGEQFYPTPPNLINKMLSDIKLSSINSILEPSAGKGDLVEAIINRYHSLYSTSYNLYDIDCIEKDENLVSVLKGKNLRVIHNNFLTLNTYKKYDLIIMNPPFKNGETHLLKALKMQQDGGNIICLLNASTIQKPITSAQKTLLKELEADNVSYTISYLKDEFVEAERKTNVEVALLKICIEKRQNPSYFRTQLEKAQLKKEFEQPELYEVAENDIIGQIVKQFELEVGMGLNLIKEYQAMLPYMKSKFSSEVSPYTDYTLELTVRDSFNNILSVNHYLNKVRKKYWFSLFANEVFVAKLTSDMRQDLYNRVDELSNYDFSYYNIKELQLELNKNLSLGIENTILKVFDNLSSKYSYTEYSSNIHLYNGWKTNKSWYINKKVIIPFSGFNTWGSLRLDTFKISEYFTDIETTLNYLSGNKPLKINIVETLRKASIDGKTKFHFNFFDVVFYKKGTAHITFTDLDLLKRLNLFAGQHKSWLPPSYGKKFYNEMTEEEKSVIDEFEGAESYSKVMENPDKWLIDTPSPLELNYSA